MMVYRKKRSFGGFDVMKKNILIVGGGIVLVVAVILWRLVANLDVIVANAIVNVGSDVLKTKVSVSGVSIDLKAGKAGIAGLTVANPEGYSRSNLFDMEGIEVDIDLKSIGKDVLVIETIRVANPMVIFEGDQKGGSNMQTLLDNIESASSDGSSGSAAPGEQIKLIINNFEFSGGQVKASSELKPGEVMDIKLPAIRMTGIGKAEGGVSADVVAKQIASKLVSTVIGEAAKKGLKNVIEEKAKGLLDKIKGSD
jgi:hypothetical protein